MKSIKATTNAIISGCLILLFGLGFISLMFYMAGRSVLDEKGINIMAYLVSSMGVAWIIIGIGLMGNKKWLAKGRQRFLWGSFILIFIQAIFWYGYVDHSGSYGLTEWTILDYGYWVHTAFGWVTLLEIILCLSLLLPTLNSKKIIASLNRNLDFMKEKKTNPTTS